MMIRCSIHMLVEPCMVVLMIACISGLMFFDTILQADMWYDETGNETFVKWCLKHKKDSSCKAMSNNVTNSLSNVHTYINIEGGLLAIIFNILIGYLSDRYSRRLSMVIGGFSTLILWSVTLVNSVYLAMPIWIYYIATLIQNMGGNFMSYFGASFAYISDTSDHNSRTNRIAIADACLQLGAIIGAALGGVLISNAQWYVCPSVSVVLVVIVLVYTVLVLRNPATVIRGKETTLKETLKGMIDVYTTKTPNIFRIYILSAAYLLHFTAFLAYASFIVPYLLNPPFNWENSTIGYLGSISSIANVLLLLGVPIWKRCGLSEPVLGTLSCIICGAGYTVIAVSDSYFPILVGSLMKGASGISIAIYRARLSKLVQVNQYGQLFAVLGSSESLATLIGTMALYQIYNLTRDWFQGFTFFILTFLEICAAILTIYDAVLQKRCDRGLLINEEVPVDDDQALSVD